MLGADAIRVAWYRFRCTWGARWTGYLALVLLLGLIGGLAPFRRGGQPRIRPGPAPRDREAAGCPPRGQLRRAERGSPRSGGTIVAGGSQGLSGSIDGEFFTQDRVTVVRGRMANPARADEAVVDVKGTPGSVKVGMVAPIGFFTNAQEASPDYRPRIRSTRCATAARCSPRRSPDGWPAAARRSPRPPSSSIAERAPPPRCSPDTVVPPGASMGHLLLDAARDGHPLTCPVTVVSLPALSRGHPSPSEVRNVWPLG